MMIDELEMTLNIKTCIFFIEVVEPAHLRTSVESPGCFSLLDDAGAPAPFIDDLGRGLTVP